MFILTHGILLSDWCLEELQSAINNKKKVRSNQKFTNLQIIVIRDLGCTLPDQLPKKWEPFFDLLKAPDLIWVAEYNAACIKELKKKIGLGDKIRETIKNGEAKLSEDGKAFSASNLEESADLKTVFYLNPEVRDLKLTKCLVDPADLAAAA